MIGTRSHFISLCIGILTLACAVAGCSSQVGTPGSAENSNMHALVVAGPRVTATPTPIPLYKGGTIGTIVFPDGDSPSGGQGAPVDGLPCPKDLSILYHHHVRVAFFANNQQIAIPRALGFVPPWQVQKNGFADNPKCHYLIHTHDATGVVHLEFHTPPSPMVTLGNVFDVWGEPLSAGNVAGYTGTLTVFVNGKPYPYAVRNMKLGQDHIQITLEINSFVTPPVYGWSTY